MKTYAKLHIKQRKPTARTHEVSIQHPDGRWIFVEFRDDGELFYAANCPVFGNSPNAVPVETATAAFQPITPNSRTVNPIADDEQA